MNIPSRSSSRSHHQPQRHIRTILSSVSICALLIATGLCLDDGGITGVAGIVSSAHAFGGGSRMPQPPPNYEGKQFYKVLGVNTDAKPEEIRRQFRRLAKKHHPDMQGQHGKTPLTDAQTKANSEKFKTITEAYQVLSDKDKRKEYDLYRQDPTSQKWGRGPPGTGGQGGFPQDFGFPPGFEDDFTGGGSGGGFPGAPGGGKQGGKDPSGMPNSFDEFLRREFGDSFFSNFNGEEDDNFMQDEADMEKYARDGGEGSERNLFRDASRRKRDREAKQRSRTRDAMKETLKKMGAGSTSGSEEDLEDPVHGLKVPTGVDPEKLFTMRGGSASQGPKNPRHGPAVPPPKKQKSKRPTPASSKPKDTTPGSSWFGGLFGGDGEGGKKKPTASEIPESDDPLSYYAATDDELVKSQRAQDRIKWAERKAFAAKHASSEDTSASDDDEEEIDPSEMSDEEVDMVMAELAIREAKDDAEINSNIYTTSEEKAVLRKIKTAERERKIKRLRGVIMAKQKVLEEQESVLFRQQQAARAAKSSEERKRAREETFDRSKMFGAAPPNPDDLFEEVLQEDMYGQQRLVRRRKKKRAHNGDDETPATGLDEDPLESTYSEHVDDTPMGSQFGKNKKVDPKKEYEEDTTNFIVPDASKTKKQTAADEATTPPTSDSSSDPDPMDHLRSKDESIPKPRSLKEKNMMKWAYEMAKKMGTRAPMGVDPTKAGTMSAKEAAEHMAKSGIDPLTGEKLRPGQKPSMPKSAPTPPTGGADSGKKKNTKKDTKKSDGSTSDSKHRTPSANPTSVPKQAPKQQSKSKRGKQQGTGAGHRGTMNFGEKPDMNVKPTDEQMAAMEKLFGDPKKAGLSPEEVVKSEHVDPETYSKIFKSGRPPTEEELRDINGNVYTGGSKDSVTTATRTPKKAATPTLKKKKQSHNVGGSTNEEEESTQLTVENFESYCGGGSGSNIEGIHDEEESDSKTNAKKACVVLVSSATSLPALIRIAAPTAKRYPVSTKTFYVTRSNVDAITSFLFERVRVAHREAGRPEPPIEFKEALCRTYRVSTTSNAGEICAIVIRDGGLGVQVVGRQRLENYDIPQHLKAKLDGVVDGAIAPPAGVSGVSTRVGNHKMGGVVPNSIVRGKDAEALVYLPIKRGTFQWIDQFGSP